MTNDEYLAIQAKARADAEAGRARSNDHTSNGRANDVYNATYNANKK